MKLRLLILSVSNILFFHAVIAQEVESILFRYSCVPTSTSDYSIEITGSGYTLKKTNKIPGKNNRIIKVDSSRFTHAFNTEEKMVMDSIIKVNRLDSPGLYNKRITEWGSQWNVEILRNSISYNINLPNYTNTGLESLIHFIVCLVPKKERPFFECKECN